MKTNESGRPTQRFTKVLNYILEELARTKISPAAFRLIIQIARLTYGFHREWDKISYTRLVRLTGLTRDNTSKTMRVLLSLNIIERQETGKRNHYMIRIQPDVNLWRTHDALDKVNGVKRAVRPAAIGENNRDSGAVKPLDEKVLRHTQEKKREKINLKKKILKKKAEGEKSYNPSPKELKIIHVLADKYNSMAADEELEEVKFIEEGPLILEQALRMTRDKFFMEHFDEVLEKVRNSDFLRGRVTNFKADFEWLLNKNNFIKILNGRYDGKSSEDDSSEGFYMGDPDSELEDI